MTPTSSRNIPRDVIGSERLRSATEHRDHESVLAVAGLPEETGELLRPLIRASNGISVHSEAASARLGVATTLLRSSVEDESPMASRVRLIDRIAVSLADYLAAARALRPRFAEMLVIDNGSNDGSADTVEREFPPFRVVWLGTNLGAGGARNAGLREANNDRILFIDNDVALTDRCITRLTEALESHPGSSLAAATIGWQLGVAP